MNEANRREAELVGRCANGDHEAWAAFVRGYGTLVAALARRLLVRYTGRAVDTDVDEVVADVFLALLRQDRKLLHRFNPEYRLSTYLGIICRTEALRGLRRKRRQPHDLEEAGHIADDADHAGPLRALQRDEREDAIQGVREALRHLSERDRLLITLKYLDGADYAAIASQVGVSPESVGQLLTRAKRRLAARVPHLEGWLAEPEASG